MINLISSSRYKIDRKKIRKIITDFLLEKGYPKETTINIVMVGKNKMRAVSAKYKQEDVALPVLSFSYEDEKKSMTKDYPLGEVLICYPQAVLLAAQRFRKVEETLVKLIKHGVENIIK